MSEIRIGFFEACAAEETFLVLRETVLKYWNAKPADRRPFFDMAMDAETRDSQKSAALRSQISLTLPKAKHYASQLGARVTVIEYPPPAVGGPILTIDPLDLIVDSQMGHRTVSRQRILDTINNYLGAAKVAKAAAFKRLVLPWYWVIDLPAFVIRIPFLILRRTGLPSAIEENVISQVIKVAVLLALLATASYFGIRVTGVDVMGLLK